MTVFMADDIIAEHRGKQHQIGIQRDRKRPGTAQSPFGGHFAQRKGGQFFRDWEKGGKPRFKGNRQNSGRGLFHKGLKDLFAERGIFGVGQGKRQRPAGKERLIACGFFHQDVARYAEDRHGFSRQKPEQGRPGFLPFGLFFPRPADKGQGTPEEVFNFRQGNRERCGDPQRPVRHNPQVDVFDLFAEERIRKGFSFRGESVIFFNTHGVRLLSVLAVLQMRQTVQRVLQNNLCRKGVNHALSLFAACVGLV